MTDNIQRHLDLSIETTVTSLARDLMGDAHTLRVNDTVDIPGNATLCLKRHTLRLGLDVPQTIEFVVTFGTGVGSSLLASWIYSKLFGKTSKVTINRHVIEMSEGEIRRIIQETIERS